MEGIFEFITSVNKISLAAFFGVFVFLIYEINLLRREHLKKQKPVLPHFNTSAVASRADMQRETASVPGPKKAEIERRSRTSPALIIILIIMLFSFLGFSIYSVFTGKKRSENGNNAPKILIREISSPGLKVYNSSWIEVKDIDSAAVLKPGVKVYLGLLTIDEADIDRARIKVNEKEWNIKHITNQFNKEKKVYYREYTIATGDAKLSIDAQLHSATDGWLGD